MEIFNSGYDRNSNPKDSAGYSYDRNSGSYLGKVDKEDHTGSNFFGKLILICFIIYILPGFMGNLAHRHPEIKIIFWIIVGLWIFRKIRRVFK